MQRLNRVPGSQGRVDPDPRLVVVLTLCAILVCKASVEPQVFLSLQLVFLLICAITGVSMRSLLLRSLWVLPFSLAAIPLLFTVKGIELFQVGSLVATREGGLRLVVVVMHCWLCYQALLLGAAVTGPYRFVQALGALGMPSKLLEVLQLATRYLELLLDEAKRMHRAQLCRGDSRRLGLAERGRCTGQMVGSLFLRTLDRAQRVAMARKCRGGNRLGLQEALVPMTLVNRLVGGAALLASLGYLIYRA